MDWKFCYFEKEKNNMKKEIKNKEFLAKGKRVIVYTASYGGGKVVIKEKNPKSTAINRIYNEANFLKKLNKVGIGPKFIAFFDDILVMEFVEGMLIEQFVKENNKGKIVKVLKNVLQQMYKLDKLGINKEEMNRPCKHIIIGKKVVLIDWERSNNTISPKNVTQFCQFLTSSKFGSLIFEKGIVIDKKYTQKVAKEYKQKLDNVSFNKIYSLVK